MKIVSLTAENVKKLVAVNITPDGNLVQITGKNGQGKTSVLDCIWWALCGATHIQSAPIRHGARKAKIRLDLGELTVTRTFTRQDDGGFTTSIAVENPEGAVFKKGQTLIDSFLGAISFDPLAFGRMKPREQFDTLQAFVPGFDFAAHEANVRAVYGERTECGRDRDQAQAAADSIVIGSCPAGHVDEAALTAELRSAGERNAETVRQLELRKQTEFSITAARMAADSARSEIAELREKIARLENTVFGCDQTVIELQAQLDGAEPLPDITDVSELEQQLNAARETNKAADQWMKARTDKLAHQQRATEASGQYESLTARLAELKQKKDEVLAQAHFPIDGLGLGDGMVLLNDVPFDQASDAEQLRASVAIAAAMNPKLRVIRIRDGSLLDDDGVRLLGEFADAADMQVWIERVDSSGKVGFVMEDGHLKSDSEDAAA